jgi:hypothetical protein
MLAAYETRSHAMPALRYQLLEVRSESGVVVGGSKGVDGGRRDYGDGSRV